MRYGVASSGRDVLRALLCFAVISPDHPAAPAAACDYTIHSGAGLLLSYGLQYLGKRNIRYIFIKNRIMRPERKLNMNLSSVTPILDFMTFILVSVDVVTAFVVLFNVFRCITYMQDLKNAVLSENEKQIEYLKSRIACLAPYDEQRPIAVFLLVSALLLLAVFHTDRDAMQTDTKLCITYLGSVFAGCFTSILSLTAIIHDWIKHKRS